MMTSQLLPVMERYLAVREALGFSTRAARPLLHEFLAFLEGQQSLEALPAHVAFEWACGAAAPRAVTSQAARLRAVRGFLTYAKASLPEIDVPESGLLGGLRRPHPYLFSLADLTRLLDAATHLSSRSTWAATTYPTLLGLLASCGLRVGEALRLQLHDVALETTPPHLQIRHTKFRKTRLVPLHPTTVEQVLHYADLRQRWGKARGVTAFFISDRGHPLSYDIVQNTFQRLVHELALTPTAGHRRPTLHSLRHTFAVQRLLMWARQGLPVQDWVPHLAVYLGHRRPEDSYWYLTATPELLETAAVAFQQYVETGGEQ